MFRRAKKEKFPTDCLFLFEDVGDFFTILRMYERAESTLSEKSREFRIYITCTVALHITWESNLACIYVVAPPSLYKEIKMKSNFFFQKRETTHFEVSKVLAHVFFILSCVQV